eukprot:TRINITY_DN2225_c0_g1_i6.p1 TRINITY_DN2225_c0_g1~~TRINITY_DN2225_c0_g1_i6.p1  ORF type:complete len:497 (-),score=24.19 TRINITY_DN2225_c0_g1_i6:527-2017(-)
MCWSLVFLQSIAFAHSASFHERERGGQHALLRVEVVEGAVTTALPTYNYGGEELGKDKGCEPLGSEYTNVMTRCDCLKSIRYLRANVNTVPNPVMDQDDFQWNRTTDDDEKACVVWVHGGNEIDFKKYSQVNKIRYVCRLKTEVSEPHPTLRGKANYYVDTTKSITTCPSSHPVHITNECECLFAAYNAGSGNDGLGFVYNYNAIAGNEKCFVDGVKTKWGYMNSAKTPVCRKAISTSSPTASPTVAPTKSPTVAPTVAPTVSPTVAPTVAPTAASGGSTTSGSTSGSTGGSTTSGSTSGSTTSGSSSGGSSTGTSSGSTTGSTSGSTTSGSTSGSTTSGSSSGGSSTGTSSGQQVVPQQAALALAGQAQEPAVDPPRAPLAVAPPRVAQQVVPQQAALALAGQAQEPAVDPPRAPLAVAQPRVAQQVVLQQAAPALAVQAQEPAVDPPRALQVARPRVAPRRVALQLSLPQTMMQNLLQNLLQDLLRWQWQLVLA